MINFDVDFSKCRSEEVMFLLTLSVCRAFFFFIPGTCMCVKYIYACETDQAYSSTLVIDEWQSPPLLK